MLQLTPMLRTLNPQHVTRRAGLLLGLVCLIGVLGCGGSADLGSVTGTVTLDGKPLDHGTVYFLPEAGHGAEGEIQSDGTYRLGTYGKSDGALVGEHRVGVAVLAKPVWPPNYDNPDRSSKSELSVPAHYGSPQTSGIRYTVQPGSNEYNIELVSK